MLQVKQAFYDDRKGRAIIDERERVARAAAAAQRATGLSPEPQATTRRRQRQMPGTGHTLKGDVIEPGERSEDDDESHHAEEDDDEV